MPGINQDEINAEADLLLCLPDPTLPITTAQARMIEMDLDELLLETFGTPEVVQTWLDVPNPLLAGDSPAARLERGDTVAVRRLLLMATTGMPT